MFVNDVQYDTFNLIIGGPWGAWEGAVPPKILLASLCRVRAP